MLSEELILHYIPKVFKGYQVKEKSLLRVTRNADIDADALYDEDLDYREFMAELIKRRKKLSPVRIELSRKLSEESVKMLCGYLTTKPQYVFLQPVSGWICPLSSRSRMHSARSRNCSMREERRENPRHLPVTGRSLTRSKKRTNCFPIRMRASTRS